MKEVVREISLPSSCFRNSNLMENQFFFNLFGNFW